MRLRLFALVLFLLPLSANAALDIYGGDASHACAGTLPGGGAIPGATGYFYLYKDTNLTHWMFCDPLGNRMWMTGVQVVDYGGNGYTSIANAKYGAFGSSTGWEASQTTRLQAMGFNTVGEFSRFYMWPPSGKNPNSIAFNYFVSPAHYFLGAKDIFANLPPKWDSTGGYRGYRSLDLYDPLWTGQGTGVGGSLWACTYTLGISCATFDASPWLVLTTMDDVAFVSQIYTNQSTYAVGIAAPYEQFESSLGYNRKQVFSDPVMHTKQQWGTWLCNTRYANLAALNTAWGSSYDSCGSDATTSGTETIGIGNGSSTSFSATLSHSPVDPASIGISVGGVLQGGDTPWFNANECTQPSGMGCIQAATGTINGGTITYSSGAITVTFSAAPANGVAITCTYQYNGWPKATTQQFTYTQQATDNFNRAGPGLGANWTQIGNDSALQIVSNVAEPTSTAVANYGAYYSAISWPNDQASRERIGGTFATANDGVIPAVRVSAGANPNFYTCYVPGPANSSVTAMIQKYLNGSFNTNLATVSLTPQVGDDIECGVIGTTITLKQIRSGSTIASLSASDSAIASGSAGIRVTFYPSAGSALTEDTITLWTGYSLAATAGIGQGILDEDGTSTWWPSGNPVSRTDFPDPPVGTIQTDMDVFLGLTVAQYLKPVHDWIKANLPHHLVGSVDPAGQGYRTQVYNVMATNADVLLYGGGLGVGRSDWNGPAVSAYNGTPRPIVVGIYDAANPDSAFSGSSCPYNPALCFGTQDLKGAFYSSQLNTLYSNTTGMDGYGFIVGADYWQYTDNSAEQGAYGLVSLNDNLYNAANCPASGWPKEDVNSSITDHFGFTTTAEAATYGNFICGGVVAGNAIWLGSQPIVVSITQQPPASLQVNAVATIIATVANDGGAAGVDWTLTCGGGSCGSITAHTASGVAATYTAPAAVPPGAVVATATSTTDNTKSATANGITITTAANVICCAPKNRGWLP